MTEGKTMSSQEKETKQPKPAGTGGERVNLDSQYGRIGISSVAAALPFVGKAKNTGHTSGAREDERRRDGRRHSVLAI